MAPSKQAARSVTTHILTGKRGARARRVLWTKKKKRGLLTWRSPRRGAMSNIAPVPDLGMILRVRLPNGVYCYQDRDVHSEGRAYNFWVILGYCCTVRASSHAAPL
jgi:hypothetical protein